MMKETEEKISELPEERQQNVKVRAVELIQEWKQKLKVKVNMGNFYE